MKTTIRPAALLALCSILASSTYAQDQRAFNQNASRSNHTRLASADTWSMGFNAGGSFAAKSNQNSLFRGNSFATKLSANYSFDKIGIGFSSGIIPGSISEDAVNSFMTERKFPIDQVQVTTSKPFNSYLLAGPSFRFGNRVAIIAGLQGGIFFNDPGSVSISQQGVNRLLYGFQAGDQKVFPGFAGSINIAYPISSSTQFVINTDYLQSRSSIRLLDPTAGIDVPTQQNRDLKLFTAGIGIIKTFGSNSSADARKRAGKAKYNNIVMREANPSPASTASCGPVTQRTTNTDGTTEEMVFSCPADAAAYAERISMNVTVPKQTQGATFGEKVNQGLHAAGSAVAQGASRHIISGKLTWLNANEGIVTNKSISLAGGGGGAAAASYARTTPATSFGTLVRFQAREASSGRPSGKREKGSGIVTGRRSYEPAYSDNGGTECISCIAAIQTNPLYSDKGTKGNNPLYNGKQASASDDEGVSSIDVSLINIATGYVIAQTRTEADGSFFFANVPDGLYTVRLTGGFITRKGYDVVTSGPTDLSGTVALSSPPMQLFINTEEGTDAPVQKAGISTSRSNIRSKSLTSGETDLNGNGSTDSVTNLSFKKMIPVTVPDITGAQKTVAAPFVPGGTVVSAMQRVGPIKGVIVKGGHNSKTIETDENGEFEFSNLEAGSYVFTFEQHLFVADETDIVLESRVQDHNSSRSNKSASVIAPDPNNVVQAKVQDHNSSRSNKSASSIAVDADLDGDGVYETDVTSKVSDKINLNENGEVTAPQQKAGVSTSRSNIRTRGSLQPIGNDLYLCYAITEINNKTVPVKIIYK